MKIFYNSINLIPSTDEIICLAKQENFVIELPKKELPPNEEIKLIAQLKNDLTDNYSVFKSGIWKETITITVKPLIKNDSIIKCKASIISAINDYITISNKLFNNKSSDKKVTQNWQLVEEHGEHNRYRHKKSGQILETNSFNFEDIDNIDPYFFGLFIKTSLKYNDLKSIIIDDFHDSTKILEFIKDKKDRVC